MSESKDNPGMLDGPDAFPDFGNPAWIANMEKELGLDLQDAEFSARARKKKRIYKRKKTEKMPNA
jgi:hypothetical protein